MTICAQQDSAVNTHMIGMKKTTPAGRKLYGSRHSKGRRGKGCASTSDGISCFQCSALKRANVRGTHAQQRLLILLDPFSIPLLAPPPGD